MYVRLMAEYARAGCIPCRLHTKITSRETVEWRVQGLEGYPHSFSQSFADVFKAASTESEYIPKLVVPEADRILPQLLGQWKAVHNSLISLLIMRPRATQSLKSQINYFIKLVFLATIRFSFSQVKIFAETSQGTNLPLLCRALGIKPLVSPFEWNPGMELDELGLLPEQMGKTLFLVAGDLSQRKYISEIIHAWDAIKPERAILVLVGKISPNLEQELSKMITCNDSIIHCNKYVSNKIFDSWIDEADYIFLLHKNAANSGVAQKASLSKKAIVICGGNKAHISAIQNMMPNSIALKVVSRAAIESQLLRPRTNLRYIGPPSNPMDPRTWADLFTCAIS